eukprot:TRINITY_DN4625_c0_g1_i8.p1 TRINITY_DN4625_c0_g1~~TRINITY_DN4625_c0_g1_i8.p1  ORF type:complete len:380 (-),score=42.59 TRINITY_DN4625_c0_g1_i8:86-1225(-)
MENTISHLTDVELPQANISPIVGVFGDAHSKPFLDAIEACSLAVPDAPAIAASSVFFAESAEKTNLSLDEVAAINLYTIECNFYRVFNQTLRERDRKKLLPFFPYLKHLLLGLNKLPSFNGKLWRGVKLDLRKNYPEGKKFFWWSFSSCTVSLKVLESEQFCGKTGNRTIFCISSQKGKDIKMFSNYADEGEVLLMPGYFIVKGVMEPAEGCTIIDLEELPPPFDIFIGFPKSNTKTPFVSGSKGSGSDPRATLYGAQPVDFSNPPPQSMNNHNTMMDPRMSGVFDPHGGFSYGPYTTLPLGNFGGVPKDPQASVGPGYNPRASMGPEYNPHVVPKGVCAGCRKYITGPQRILALGKDYHPEHFLVVLHLSNTIERSFL